MAFPPDLRERETANLARILSKVLAMFPVSGRDNEATLEAYAQELEGFPSHFVSRGFRKLVDEPERVFMPTVPEVRRETARAIRAYRRAQAGLSARVHGPNGEPYVQIERESNWGRRVVLRDYEQQKKLAAGWRPREIAE